MTRFGLLAVTGLGSLWIVLAPWGVTAEQASQPREGDVAAIRRAGQEYVAALRRGDAEALAAHWVPGGMYMDATDRSFDARALIQQQFGSDPPQGVVRSVEVDANSSIRFVTADVAIEEGTARDANGTDAGRGRFTAVWVKKGPRWLLESLREWQPKSSSPKSSLEALAWMLGKWVGHGENITVRWSGSWSENDKFIVRRFTVEREGSVLRSGTQRIGWDAAAGKIRSWTFLSDGTVVDGNWRQEDQAWIEKTNGVLADGKRSSAINFWIPEGEDRWVMKSRYVKVAGTELEDSLVEFQREQSQR